MLCRRVVTKDRRYITQITCYERGRDGTVTRTHHGQEEVIGRIGELSGLLGSTNDDDREALRLPIFGKEGAGASAVATPPDGGPLTSLFHLDRRQLSGGTDI